MDCHAWWAFYSLESLNSHEGLTSQGCVAVPVIVRAGTPILSQSGMPGRIGGLPRDYLRALLLGRRSLQNNYYALQISEDAIGITANLQCGGMLILPPPPPPPPPPLLSLLTATESPTYLTGPRAIHTPAPQ